MINFKKQCKDSLVKIIDKILNIKNKDVYEGTGWIAKIVKYYDLISLFMRERSLFFILSELSKRIHDDITNDPSLYVLIKKNYLEYLKNNDNEISFYITKILYIFGVFDDDVCREIINFANKTKNVNYRYWTTMDISRFTFHLQKGFYTDYYTDRRELIVHICKDLKLKLPQKSESQNNNNNKLCIIVHLLNGTLKNSVSRVAAMVSNGLINEFNEIFIISLDTFSPTKTEFRFLTSILPYKASSVYKTDINKLLPDRVKFYYADGDNWKSKSQNALDKIYEYNPSVIFDMSDEYSFLSYHYYKDFHTVYFPLRDTNSSLFFNNIIGAPKWKFEQTNIKYKSVDLKKVRNWNFPEYVPPKSICHCRKSLNIDEKAFVIISIGNNSTTFTDEFVDEMCAMVQKNDFVWILVGDGAPDYLKRKYSFLLKDKQIIEYGYENNLYSLCSICNVHLRPNMTGGSGATAIAALAGLPIAMTNYLCDPSRWLGLDFLINIKNYKDLKEYIVQLSKDSTFYENEKTRVSELIEKAVDTPNKWKELSIVLHEG